MASTRCGVSTESNLPIGRHRDIRQALSPGWQIARTEKCRANHRTEALSSLFAKTTLSRYASAGGEGPVLLAIPGSGGSAGLQSSEWLVVERRNILFAEHRMVLSTTSIKIETSKQATTESKRLHMTNRQVSCNTLAHRSTST